MCIRDRLGSVRRLETLELEEAETKWESVRLALELSYEALRDKEPKQRFRALGTFAVGATFNAAAAAGVWGCDENEVVDGLRRLARAAMVDRLERGRWRVHDLLMDYALERLVEAGEEAAARERHARYYLEFAEAHEEDWQAIEAELAQIRAGWRWATSLDEVNEELVLSYALGLKDFQRTRGYWGEGLVWLKRGRQACESLGKQRKLVSVLNAMGLVYGKLGQHSLALQCFEQALALPPVKADAGARAETLQNIAGAYWDTGVWRKAVEYLEQVVAIDKLGTDKASLGSSLNALAVVYYDLGEVEKALPYYQEARAIFEEVGDRASLAGALNNIGQVQSQRGELREALANLKRARAIWEEVGDRVNLALALNNIGEVHRQRGELGEALANYERARAIFEEVGDRASLAVVLNNIGQVQSQRGELGEALANLERARAIFEEVGNRASLAVALNNIGGVQSQRGELREALANYERARAILEEVGDRANLGLVKAAMGLLYETRDETERALRLLREGVTLMEAAGGHPQLENAWAALRSIERQYTSVAGSDDSTVN